jgi:hypothetical protein
MIDARPILTRVVLIGAVGLGAWHVLVRPLHEKADALRGENTLSRAEVEGGESLLGDDSTDPGRVLAALRARGEAYEAWWTPHAEHARLYDAIRAVATGTGVELTGVEPGRVQVHALTRDGAGVLRTESSVINARGSFAGLLGFIDALRRELDTIRVDSLTITPGDIAEEVRGDLTVTRFVFERAFPSLAATGDAP